MASDARDAGRREPTGQVLEFSLGGETYCVSIDYVAEIVDVGEVTSVPGAPAHVEGVMNLRGRTTSVVDPAVLFDVDDPGERHRIVVFDPAVVAEPGAVGWVVDEVSRVLTVEPGAVDPAPGETRDAVVGVVRHDDGFLVWVDPRVVHGA